MEKTEKDISKELNLWSIQEDLLQSYRVIFISSESILLSVATVSVVSSQQYWLGAISFILLMIPSIYMILIWDLESRKRGEGVYYSQYLSILKESGKHRDEKLVKHPVEGLKYFMSYISSKKLSKVWYYKILQIPGLEEMEKEWKVELDKMTESEEWKIIKGKSESEHYTRGRMERLPLVFLFSWVVLLFVTTTLGLIRYSKEISEICKKITKLV